MGGKQMLRGFFVRPLRAVTRGILNSGRDPRVRRLPYVEACDNVKPSWCAESLAGRWIARPDPGAKTSESAGPRSLRDIPVRWKPRLLDCKMRPRYPLTLSHRLILQARWNVRPRCDIGSYLHLKLLRFIWLHSVTLRYTVSRVIKQFRHKGLQRLFDTGSKAGVQAAHVHKLRRQLARLDAASSSQDMNVPGWKLHALTGDLSGHWSVLVSGNWRLTFTFDGEDAVLVDYRDYH